MSTIKLIIIGKLNVALQMLKKTQDCPSWIILFHLAKLRRVQLCEVLNFGIMGKANLTEKVCPICKINITWRKKSAKNSDDFKY